MTARRIKARSFYGKVWKESGPILPGRASIRSSRFSTYEDARNWNKAWMDDPDVKGNVMASPSAPEIIRCDCGSLMVVTRGCPECNKVEA